MKPANIINKKNRKFVISNWITLGILTVVLVGVSIPSVVFGAECTPAELAAGGRNQTFSATGASTVACVMPTQPGQNSSVAGVAVDYLVSPLFQGIARLLMGFSSLILMLSGLIFYKVIDFFYCKNGDKHWRPQWSRRQYHRCLGNSARRGQYMFYICTSLCRI